MAHFLDIFSHYIVVKIVLFVCKSKNKRLKRSRMAHLLNKNYNNTQHPCTLHYHQLTYENYFCFRSGRLWRQSQQLVSTLSKWHTKTWHFKSGILVDKRASGQTKITNYDSNEIRGNICLYTTRFSHSCCGRQSTFEIIDKIQKMLLQTILAMLLLQHRCHHLRRWFCGSGQDRNFKARTCFDVRGQN